MSEYRNEVRRVGKEVPFTLWTVFKWGVPTILVVALLGFLAQSLGIVSLNIQREVVQHSQQYVETKVNLLNKLHNDWLQLSAEIAELRTGGEGNAEIVAAKRAQQRNTETRIRTEADMIPSSQVPSTVRTFLDTRGR